MNRRTWLRRTAGASAGLVAAGTLGSLAHIWVLRGADAEGLTPAGKAVLTHMSRGVLAGFLASHASDRERILHQAMNSIAAGAARLPKLVKLQLGGLLAAVDSPASRYLLTGVSHAWDKLSDAEVAQALDRMRLSSDLPTLVAYKALRNLVCLQVFSDRDLQAMTTYPGPLDI
ncbi:hypothetical protein [Aquabacterium sp. NJ1]|uniref:hypothetical protein n=1 Tax=Aquabacterium sp. NJ1 TaxID=1538295 RepID=UPI00126A760D|nr:hypothetical protein [Aquabacterium sp. NJ1]